MATPDTSPHVSGDAVDIGPFDATAWLAEHGTEYGLCRVDGNEPWHYELRPDAIDHRCPPMYGDPTQDPRMEVGEQHAAESQGRWWSRSGPRALRLRLVREVPSPGPPSAHVNVRRQ